MAIQLAKIDNILLPDGREWYHEKYINSDCLTITVGDSWTWGDRLGKTTLDFDDREYRVKHIYGNILSEKLNSDFINVGIPGGSNLYILLHLRQVLDTIVNSYKKIYVVFTLTESGRELSNGFLQQRDHYNLWAGPDWPSYDDIINQTATHDQLELVFKDTSDTYFNCVIGLYVALQGSTNTLDLLKRYEQYTVDTIKKYVPNVILARNFTSFTNADLFDIKERWTDIISIKGNLESYPDSLYVLSQIGVDPLLEITKHFNKNWDKQEWLDILTQSTLGIDWLAKSPYNSKVGTMHPLEQGHSWWAQHLFENITE